MEVDLAVLADSANRSENGKLNILGIFDNFNIGPIFPAQTPSFSIVIRVVLHPSELGSHDFLVRLADADGKEIAKIAGNFETSRRKRSAKPFRSAIILQAQVTFPEPGDYSFDILLNGRWEKAMPLEVRSVSQ